MKKRNIDQMVMLFAGSMNTLGLVLAAFVSPYWVLLSAFVGLNMIQASFTGFCPLVWLLKKMGFEVGPSFT